MILSVKIPDATAVKPKQKTIRRRFLTTDALSHVFAWIKNELETAKKLELVLMYPQLVLTENMNEECLSDVGVVENTAFVFRYADVA